jgi:hypothetical protein
MTAMTAEGGKARAEHDVAETEAREAPAPDRSHEADDRDFHGMESD